VRREQVEQLVSQLAGDICAGLGLMLVDCTYRKSDRAWRILVRIDRVTGVSIDDCAEVSRQLDARLDEMDPIEHQYTLEVSSAGLSGLLKTDTDYQRFIGRPVELELNRPGKGARGRKSAATDAEVVVGKLLGLTPHCLTIENDQGAVEVPRQQVRRARPAVDFRGGGVTG